MNVQGYAIVEGGCSKAKSAFMMMMMTTMMMRYLASQLQTSRNLRPSGQTKKY